MLTRCSRALPCGRSRAGRITAAALFHLPYTRIFTKPDQMQPVNSGQGGPPVVLPKRQLQVLLLMCAGLTGKEIAQRLGISPKTVEFHRAGIYKRLGLKTTAHLVRYAIRMGLIEP